MARQDLFITWLNDAHAMENVVSTALKDQVALAAGHSEVQRANEGHLEATHRHMETAFYESLIVGANDLGHTTMASNIQGIMEDEKQMARWLQEQIPTLTQQELAKADA